MEEELRKRKEELVRIYELEGILRSPSVREAFLKVPREEFVLPKYRRMAYDDMPLPTLRGQTISAPHMAVILLEALDLKPGMKVLEVGTGTGYQAALMAELVGPEGKVITIERIKELAEIARANLERLGYKNVKVIRGDGLKGYPEEAPYDRILIAACIDRVPSTLIEQLKPYGILVAPIRVDYWTQRLTRITKLPNGKLKKERLMPVAFVEAREGVEERKITQAR